MINKINPIYLLASLFIIFIISFTMKNSYFNALENNKQEFKDFKTDAKKYLDIKNNWSNLKKSGMSISNIISDKSFKNSKIIQNSNATSIQIQIEDKDLNVLSKFLTKVLNEKLLIKNLLIQKDKISFEVEVK